MKAVQAQPKAREKFVLVSRSEYFDFLDKIKKNPELLVSSETLPQGVQITSTDGSSISSTLQASIEQAKENMRKRNNPLEIE